MKNLSVMIKPASSLCNMRCKYCFYADISSIREQPSYGVMTSETRKKVLSNIFSQLDSGDSITFDESGAPVKDIRFVTVKDGAYAYVEE